MGRVYGMLPEWLNSNAHRAFPLSEGSVSSVDENGATVPDWLLLDFRMTSTMTRTQSSPSDACCSVLSYSMEVADPFGIRSSVRVGFMDSESVDISSDGIIPFGGFRRVSSSVSGLRGTTRFYVVFGAPAAGEDVGRFSGSHVLSDPAPFLYSRQIWIPGGVGVRTISTNNGPATAETVYVRDGNNTSFRIENGKLRLTVGRRLGNGFDCLGPGGSDPRYSNSSEMLYSINGQRPDAGGNLVIAGGPGVTVGAGELNGVPAVVIGTSSAIDSFAKQE